MTILQYINQHKQDGIMYLAGKWMDEAGNNARDKGVAAEKTAALLALIPNDAIRNSYTKTVSALYKSTVSAKELQTSVSNLRSDAFEDEEEKKEGQIKFPDWITDKEAVMLRGYAEQINKSHTGYYFLVGGERFTKATNFVIKPLYHVYSQNISTNRRIVYATNGFDESIVEIPSKDMLSVTSFVASLYKEGTYLREANYNDALHLKLLGQIDKEFKKAYELDTLGWQPGSNEGFFAFSNKAYMPATKPGGKGSLTEYNEYGVVAVGDRFYLSPSNSKANLHVRESENMYENDKYLCWKDAPLRFDEWAELMCKVYGQNAWFAIPFVIATLFRDVVLKVTKIPHLYAYGSVGAGKSEYGESVSYLFFSGMSAQGELYKPFNLNQGTEFAFWNALERFYNCPIVFNEFDENAIDEHRFRAIKSAYDNEGRMKGQKEGNRTKTQKTNGTIILLGQYLGTKDDNAVLMRSIPLSFRRDDNRTDEQVANFSKLKELERKGLSGILCEILDIRADFTKTFADVFAGVRGQMLADIRAKGGQVPERILKNIACMVSCVNIAAAHFRFPFTTDAFYQYAVEFTRNMAGLINRTSGITEFFKTLEFLQESGRIHEGKEFMIKEVDSITVNTDDGEKQDRSFNGMKKVLLLRLSNVHMQYMEMHRKTTGRTPLNEQTLLLYMKDQPYFIGAKKNHRFKDKITSCYVLDYDMLNISLERHMPEQPSGEQVIISGKIQSDVNILNEGLVSVWVTVFESVKPDPTKEGGYPTNDAPKTEAKWYNCHFHDSAAVGQLVKGYKVQLKGVLTVHNDGKKEKNNIEVIDFEAQPQYKAFERNLQEGASLSPEEELPF